MFRGSKSQFHVRFAFCSLMGLSAMAAPLSGDPEFQRPDVREIDSSSENPNPLPRVILRLYIEPIAGLTTVRHVAPDQTAVPLGTELDLFLSAPETAQVTFTGVTITSRNAQGLSATCSLSQVGRTSITASVRLQDGTSRSFSCDLDVVPITSDQIAVTAITVSVEAFDLDGTATNSETMGFYYGESIAMLQPTSTGYRTSTNREIRIVPELNHPEFAPLMEWRIDGAVTAFGVDERIETFTTVGSHTYSVGPPNRSAETVIETYSVSITSHESGADIVGEGEAITFEAVTDPPGYEDEITWLSSTKSGTAAPVVAHGPYFTVEFNDTFGPNPEGGFWQWLGVKADNAVFNQDQKPCAVSLERARSPLEGDLLARVQSSALTQGYEQSLGALGYTFDFVAATEETYMFSVSSDVPDDARHAIVPVVDGGGNPFGYYMHSSTLETEGADFVRFFTPDIDPDQMTVRTYIDPGLCAWVDAIVSEDGSVAADVVDNCPGGRGYGACMGLAISAVVLGAEKLGVGTACRALCTTCAIPPHASCIGCGVCAVGYLGCVALMWWGC